MNLQRHRRRRDIIDRQRRQSAEDPFITAVLVLVVGALFSMTAGLWVMQELEQFGPAVGGIIRFRPDTSPSERWSVTATRVEPAHLGVPATTGGDRCTLSPGAMAVHGGSLVIEARQLSRPPVYRVHWSGDHTDGGTEDCGTTADLVLQRTELMRLANVAGGFSSGLRLIGP